jgi:hypothetical protein
MFGKSPSIPYIVLLHAMELTDLNSMKDNRQTK